MSVSARFWIDEITTRGYNPAHAEVVMRPTCRGEENRAWAQATPSGEIKLTINNPDAVEFFKANQGKDVAITFDEIEMDSKSGPYEA